MVHPYRWLPPDSVSLSPFLQCEHYLAPDGSGVLADPAKIDEEFRKAWLPYFCRSGQREASLEEIALEVDEWLSLLPEVHLPRLTGQVLADVVQREGVSAGSLDGWGWREFKVLPVSWFDELARILAKVEDLGVWPDGLLGAYITMIPRTDGDATPLGQRTLLRTLLNGPMLLVSWLSGSPFLGSLHWPAGGLDLGVGGVSYVELIILYELWAGERLSLEKAHYRNLRQGVQFQCRLFRLVQALIFGAPVVSLVL